MSKLTNKSNCKQADKQTEWPEFQIRPSLMAINLYVKIWMPSMEKPRSCNSIMNFCHTSYKGVIYLCEV